MFLSSKYMKMFRSHQIKNLWIFCSTKMFAKMELSVHLLYYVLKIALFPPFSKRVPIHSISLRFFMATNSNNKSSARCNLKFIKFHLFTALIDNTSLHTHNLIVSCVCLQTIQSRRHCFAIMF